MVWRLAAGINNCVSGLNLTSMIINDDNDILII